MRDLIDGFDTGFRDRPRDRDRDTRPQQDDDFNGIRDLDRQSFNDGDPGDCEADGLDTTYEKVSPLILDHDPRSPLTGLLKGPGFHLRSRGED